MIELWLKFTLLSEACFSRGDGVPGVVDIEVNHDRYGFPFLGGRTLKGLLHAEATEIADALRRANAPTHAHWKRIADYLFGQPGSHHDNQGILHVGDAHLPADLRRSVAATFEAQGIHRHDILAALTTIRRQTAMDETRGAPREETLRAIRVILRDTPFTARLLLRQSASSADHQDALAFLAACVKAFRRAGTNKTRGYGRLAANFHVTPEGDPVTDDYFHRFKETLQP